MASSTLIEASVDAPHIVEISPRTKTVSIAVRTELRNVSEHDYVLYAHSEDDQHFWQMLDQNHREIWREQPRKRAASRKKTDVHPVRTQTIAAGHSTHETETLIFGATKLKDGRSYTLRHEIWGQVAETSFIAVRHAAAFKKKAAPVKKKTPARANKKPVMK
jgi:hypothetical protein